MSRHLAQNVHVGDDARSPAAQRQLRARHRAGPTAEQRPHRDLRRLRGRLRHHAGARRSCARCCEHEPAAACSSSTAIAHRARMFLEDLLALKDRYPAAPRAAFRDERASRRTSRLSTAARRRQGRALRPASCSIRAPSRVLSRLRARHMIDDVRGALHALGVEPQRIHAEHFTVETSAAPAHAADRGRSRDAASGRHDARHRADGWPAAHVHDAHGRRDGARAARAPGSTCRFRAGPAYARRAARGSCAARSRWIRTTRWRTGSSKRASSWLPGACRPRPRSNSLRRDGDAWPIKPSLFDVEAASRG